MRVWTAIEPSRLCRQHLLGEHSEVHAIWSMLSREDGAGGYGTHPEVRRWMGRLPALRDRHDLLADEMISRGYNHRSPLPPAPPGLSAVPHDWDDQEAALAAKDCECEQQL